MRSDMVLAPIFIGSMADIEIMSATLDGQINRVAGTIIVLAILAVIFVLIAYLNVLDEREEKRSGRWRAAADPDLQEYKKTERKDA